MVIGLPMVQPKRSSDRDDLEDERVRAEDILLGALGFGEEAQIIEISRSSDGYRGRGRWLDGEEFDFQSEDELSELEQWALGVLEITTH